MVVHRSDLAIDFPTIIQVLTAPDVLDQTTSFFRSSYSRHLQIMFLRACLLPALRSETFTSLWNAFGEGMFDLTFVCPTHTTPLHSVTSYA